MFFKRKKKKEKDKNPALSNELEGRAAFERDADAGLVDSSSLATTLETKLKSGFDQTAKLSIHLVGAGYELTLYYLSLFRLVVLSPYEYLWMIAAFMAENLSAFKSGDGLGNNPAVDAMAREVRSLDNKIVMGFWATSVIFPLRKLTGRQSQGRIAFELVRYDRDHVLWGSDGPCKLPDLTRSGIEEYEYLVQTEAPHLPSWAAAKGGQR